VSFSTSQGAKQPASLISQTDQKKQAYLSSSFFFAFSLIIIASPFSFTLLFLLLAATKEIKILYFSF